VADDDDVWPLILFLVDINKCVCEVAVYVSNQTRAYEFESTWRLWLQRRTACALASRLVSKAWYSWRMLSATPAYTYTFPFLWHTRCLASVAHASQLSIQLTQRAMLVHVAACDSCGVGPEQTAPATQATSLPREVWHWIAGLSCDQIDGTSACRVAVASRSPPLRAR